MNLVQLIVNYKSISEQIIKVVEYGDYDSLNDLVQEREKIVKNIDEGRFKKAEFESLFEEYNIIEIEKNIRLVMIKEKEKLKNEMQKNVINKKANKSYNTNSAKAVFLSRQI